MKLSRVLSVLFFSILVSVRSIAQSDPLLDDREISIHTVKDIEEKRRALIKYIWGSSGFPERLSPTVTTNIPTPVQGLANLKRVDEFRISLAEGLEGLAYHFIPQRANQQLVVVHHGHGCTLDDD